MKKFLKNIVKLKKISTIKDFRFGTFPSISGSGSGYTFYRPPCTMILKRMFGIKYWTSNPVWVTFQEHGNVNIEEKAWLLVKKTDRATKTSLFDRIWATSLTLRRRSRPLGLVWWALVNWRIPPLSLNNNQSL